MHSPNFNHQQHDLSFANQTNERTNEQMNKSSLRLGLSLPHGIVACVSGLGLEWEEGKRVLMVKGFSTDFSCDVHSAPLLKSNLLFF